MPFLPIKAIACFTRFDIRRSLGGTGAISAGMAAIVFMRRDDAQRLVLRNVLVRQVHLQQ
jgi:hypothetical protein